MIVYLFLLFILFLYWTNYFGTKLCTFSKCIGEKHMFQLHYKSTDVDFESFLSLFCHLLFADTK